MMVSDGVEKLGDPSRTAKPANVNGLRGPASLNPVFEPQRLFQKRSSMRAAPADPFAGSDLDAIEVAWPFERWRQHDP
jgi:hypothetical protein